MGQNHTRCTFAIISHPDAGKTTVTEKLLWWGKVIHKVGMVKSKSGAHAKSDWMGLEQQRGISITSSVLSFHFKDRAMHLLDTPGHQDFSEDTYRTLTAVESVLMMIDSAKGVEAQTIKLMDVCRLRDTPIATFLNKYDRDSMDPFELIDNLEKILSIQCAPLNWPIGQGSEFCGIYNLVTKKISLYNPNIQNTSPEILDGQNLESSEVKAKIKPHLLEKLISDLELAEGLLPQLNVDEYLAGIQTPVFFGSALYNFGVQEVIEFLAAHAPTPRPRTVKLAPFGEDAETRVVEPKEPSLTGFIFKIQANMDKNHRDRVSFLRVCSGKFQRGQKVFHVPTKKEIKISNPLIFQADSREILEEAYPGDIIGLYDTGKFCIGDTFSEGELVQYSGIPSFAPELFRRVELKDPMKGKHLEKGLKQLSEEGAAQLFVRLGGQEKLLGAVGVLQFDVVQYRLKDEYNVEANYTAVPFAGIRWLRFEDKKSRESFYKNYASFILIDHKDRPCFAFSNSWDLKLAQEKNPGAEFFNNSDYKSSHFSVE